MWRLEIDAVSISTTRWFDFKLGDIKLVKAVWIVLTQVLVVLFEPALGDVTQRVWALCRSVDETEVWAVTLSSSWRISHMGRRTRAREKGARLWKRDEMRGWTTSSLIFQFSHFLHLNGREDAPCVLARAPPTPPILPCAQRSLVLGKGGRLLGCPGGAAQRWQPPYSDGGEFLKRVGG